MFSVLEKYHQVSDGSEDLKSQFHFLKEATSKNIKNLQQAVHLQQTYSASLCSHVNVIFTRLAKLEIQIQNISDKIKMDQNEVQIDALDFDPDIDGPETQWVHHNTVVVSVHELLTSSDAGFLNASNPEEKTTDRDKLDTRDPITEDTHWSHHFPQQVLVHPVPDTLTTPDQTRTTVPLKKYCI